MRSWLALPVLVGLAACADAQPAVEVADGRADAPSADVSAWASRPPLTQATGAARAYWQGQDAAYEEDVRVFAVADGAFTQPGAEQQAVLYFMSPWPRCCAKMGLAIVEGGRLVRNVAFEGIAQTLATVPDLDGDGRDELAYTGEFGMGGQTSRSVTLVAFRDDGLTELGGTGIYDSDCAGSQSSGSTAARVTAGPGPTFVVERYAQPSCDTATWEPVDDPEPLTLDPFGTTYVDLPVR